MKIDFQKWLTILIFAILILLNLFWINNFKQDKKKIEVLSNNLNVFKLRNTELLSEVQQIIDEKGIDYNMLSKCIDFEKISNKSLLVFIPPNSCSSCVEKLLIQIGKNNEVKTSAILLSNSKDLFIINTWKNQINSNIININSPPDLFISKNKILIIWINKELQQLKFIWENPLIPEITDNFLSNGI